MSSSHFQIIEHVIPCQHIREYVDAVKDEQEVLHLAVKEYRPINNLEAVPGSVTLIATHGNGFPKEMYEPLWDDLLEICTTVKVRAIWVADSSSQGASGVLNEFKQSDDPSYFDHSRDLLLMVNHFRDRMIQPILGVAHSMGAAQMVQLSILHPRLLHSLLLIEPVIQRFTPPGPNASLPSTFRRDLWPTSSTARTALQKAPFFRAVDPRCLSLYFSHALRPTPTALYPSAPTGSVTLTTTKHQEVWSYIRASFHPLPANPNDATERLIAPDLLPEDRQLLFHCAACGIALHNLQYVRPSVQWVYGTKSNINLPDRRAEKLRMTGTGIGGNGGVEAGRVKEVMLQGSHLVVFEKVKECAEVAAAWMREEVERFESERKWLRERPSGKSERGGLVVSKEWMEKVRLPTDAKRTRQQKL